MIMMTSSTTFTATGRQSHSTSITWSPEKEDWECCRRQPRKLFQDSCSIEQLLHHWRRESFETGAECSENLRASVCQRTRPVIAAPTPEAILGTELHLQWAAAL